MCPHEVIGHDQSGRASSFLLPGSAVWAQAWSGLGWGVYQVRALPNITVKPEMHIGDEGI